MNKKAKKIGQDQGPENKKNREKGNFLNYSRSKDRKKDKKSHKDRYDS